MIQNIFHAVVVLFQTSVALGALQESNGTQTKAVLEHQELNIQGLALSSTDTQTLNWFWGCAEAVK